MTRSYTRQKTNDERFWPRVDARGVCWEWTGARRSRGYGAFWLEGKMVLAHRYSFATLMGTIPDGATLDHLCRNTSCVNPDHLDPVPLAEKIRRSYSYSYGAQMQRDKTHCAQGHPFSGDNLYIHPTTGGRVCRICRRESLQRSRDRRSRWPV